MATEANYPNFGFTVESQCEKTGARTGKLMTPHGVVETPNFLFCGTKAAVRTAKPAELWDHGVQIVLSNTYHLMLTPGEKIVEELGGLHTFMGWDGPIFTDSGGFQVFCMGHGSVSDEIKRRGSKQTGSSVLSISEEGVAFRSYVDGSKQFLTPERSIQVQRGLGADLITCFDECTPFHVDRSYTENSMHMSNRWAQRCLDEFVQHDDGSQALYGIMQGGVYPDLREQAGEFLSKTPFFGNAIGGSLGKTKGQMYEIVELSNSLLPKERPTHLLGVGHPEDIFQAVRFGIDTFDCVTPTRVARHGWALAKNGKLNLLNAGHKRDSNPIDENCQCTTCQTASRGYLHHLFKTKQEMGGALLSVHNIAFMMTLMEEVRAAIRNGTLDELEKEYVQGKQADLETPL